MHDKEHNIQLNETTICFLLLQVTKLPLKNDTYPDVDYLYNLDPAKLDSVYPSMSGCPCLENKIPLPWEDFR